MSMTNVADFVELSRHLKQERLYIASEREQLLALHASVGNGAEQLFHSAWIARQQKNALSQLILASEDTTPAVCCQQVNMIEMATVTDGYRRLTYHESKIGRFLRMLRDSPKAVATCLLAAEAAGGVEQMRRVSSAVVSGLYGNVLLSEDEHSLLLLLKHLIDIQVSRSDDPRRLLRRGSCAFSTIFKLFNEGTFVARLFLTAALYQPVMQLLMEDEWFYDIDPERALHRFPPLERIRRFGTPGTKEYDVATRQYREQITNKLVSLVEQFITSLQNNMYCFPPSLAWIVSQLYHALIKAETVATQHVARAICADLVLASFICPAVCDPEPYGITSDAPISYIARHNLMQVGQILHVLTVSSADEVDPKTRDLYNKFTKGCMSFLLDGLLDAPYSVSPPQTTSQSGTFCRSSMLLSCSELIDIVTCVHNTISTLDEDSAERKQLEEILSTSGLPPLATIQGLCSSTTTNGSLHASPNTTPQPTPPGTPSSIRKLAKLTQQSKERKKLFIPSPEGHRIDGDEVETSNVSGVHVANEVLAISLGMSSDCPGMLPEQKVLEQDGQCRQKKVKYNSLLPGEDDPVSESGILVHEKRTRFSLSHDQDSIATSDNLEAISEAASSHSVGSDLDNENDNLSDMVSANVSGRGTPNVSGRDTPISQADSQADVGTEAGEVEEEEERHNVSVAPNLPVTVQKTNRVDVTERFGKFDIRGELERDDIKSTVSDSWSTDVLASDSEPPEQNQLDRLEEVVEEPPNLLGVHGVVEERGHLLGAHEVLEISETASDAWSTDVLASDTSERQSDRLLELDQDDMASVSGRSIGVGSEVGELADIAADDSLQQASGKQSQQMSSAGSDVLICSSSASPVKMKSPSIVTYSAAFSTQVTPIISASDGIGVFQMDRYMCDSGDNICRNNAADSAEVGNVDQVDSSILETFDPLGYAQYAIQQSKDVDGIDFDVDVIPKEATSNLFVTCDSSSVSGGNSVDLQLTSSSGSLVDIGLAACTSADVVATGSSISVDTLTGCIREPTSLDTADSCESLDGQMSKQHTSAVNNQYACESGARPKTTGSVPFFPPRISISHLGDGSMQSKSSLANGKQLSGPTELVDDGCSADRSNAGRSTAFHVVQGLSTRSAVRSGLVTGTSAAATTSVIEGASGLLTSRDEEERKLQDKRKAGLFHTFRERLSKGASPVAGPVVKGNKRKVPPKLFDRDEVFRAAAEADKDVGSGSVRVLLASGEGGDDVVKGRSGNENGIEVAAVVTSDDILAKYRKPVAHKSADNIAACPAAVADGVTKSKDKVEDEIPLYDSNNLEMCQAFLDAKKKLRLILSSVDLQTSFSTHMLAQSSVSAGRVGVNEVDGGADSGGSSGANKDNELVLQLTVQLAEAINLQDRDLIAQLHETIRCVRQFDNHEIKKLLKTMKEEYRTRSAYIAYLARCRQGLLTSLSSIDRLCIRVNRDKTVVNRYLLSVLVRLFLEKLEQSILKFVSDFSQLTVSDEKADLVENFLHFLHQQMETDSIWQVASDSQRDEAKLYIERYVMSRIYTLAMFPNGEADIMRDQIFFDHMQKLSKVITPFHKDLGIPKIYHYECPWPAAQRQIYMINVYKTPKDKLQCVLRCSSTIMNLLSMANERSVPAADDFMPVLILVLIKSGVASLMSNVQYVSGFYEKRLTGEEQYWWMQFVSAIEFIKTMDYAD